MAFQFPCAAPVQESLMSSWPHHLPCPDDTIPPWPRLAGLTVPAMVLLTLPTSIPGGRRKAAFCCWYDDEAHAPSSSVSVSSGIVVFIFAPPLKTRLVAFRDLNFLH